MTIQGNVRMAVSDRTSPQDNTSHVTIKRDEQVADLNDSISILAPMNMPGGYEFFADAGNGSSYKVRVVSLCNALTARRRICLSWAEDEIKQKKSVGNGFRSHK
jgi:hypothetical protein